VTDQSDPTSLLLQQRKAPAIFLVMVAISLLLHLVVSTVVMMPGRYSGASAAPVFVELAQMPASVAPEPVAEPEEAEPPAAPETPSAVADETAPETARLERVIRNSLEQAAAEPEKIHESAIGLGMTSGYFGSFAEGETLRDEIREYYFALMRRINEVWWLNAGGGSRLARGAAINILITREGKIASIEFMEGSGDADYDRLLLETLKKAEPLPPLPRNFPQRMFFAPVRFIPPLNLMLPKFTGKSAIPHGVK
jgi:protein TonB